MSFALRKSMDTATVFLTDSSTLESRWDPNYYWRIGDFKTRVAGCPFPIEPLKKSLSLVQYGISVRATEEAIGVPMLRMINLQDDTWDLSSLKYIDMKEDEKAGYLLQEGDILFNRTNSKELVGKCSVFNLPDEYVFASYLIRVRVREGTLRPDYLTAFLSSDLGRIQIDAVSRQIAGMTNINAEEIRNLLIPRLDDNTQKLVVGIWKAAINKRDQRIEKARSILAKIDDILLDDLGIPRKSEAPNILESRIFQRKFSSLSGKRIDPASNWKELNLGGGKYPMRKLRELAAINPPSQFPTLKPEIPVSFVPMGAVSDVFGQIVDQYTRPISESGSYTPFQNGDVIWAKITPCMENGKSALAHGLIEGVGYGSTEFHVFRSKVPEFLPPFLHYLLRLGIIREHARLNFTGSSGHQRVDQDFFQRMAVPFPPEEVQAQIVEKADAAKKAARDLFAEAQAGLEEAKRDIEAIILGKEATE